MIGGMKLQTDRAQGELSMTTAILIGPKSSIFTYQLSLSYSPNVLPSFPRPGPSLPSSTPSSCVSFLPLLFLNLCASRCTHFSLTRTFSLFSPLRKLHIPQCCVYGVVGVQVKTGRLIFTVFMWLSSGQGKYSSMCTAPAITHMISRKQSMPIVSEVKAIQIK